MRRLGRMVMISLVLSVCLLQAAIPVLASSWTPNLSDGANDMTIIMKYQETVLPGMEIKLYKVADMTYQGDQITFVPTSEFSGAGVGYSEDMSSDELLKKAKTLSTYAQEQKLTAESAKTQDDGCATFKGMDAGLYLVVPQEYKGYYTLEPYLISLPQWNASSEVWENQVEAVPKTELRKKPTESETETEETEPSTGGSKGKIYPTAKRLPQTGQLKWPIPILLLAGGTLVLVGWVLMKKAKKNEEI